MSRYNTVVLCWKKSGLQNTGDVASKIHNALYVGDNAMCKFNSSTGCFAQSGVFVKCMTMPADVKKDEECKANAAR